eukprot:CAMPEP_0198216606 /NCGR_PEP_ID=MMETSP1445-20131203/58552_1 /TAXON_ID=36898 /ORGANISM="Pyramimonas sp., Strain CCMP2087" /LENGTH=62 /DNA_ID=CAMNT_0043892919 /DNA_START=27 /DNA_END=215 /DNA_ORIENTATION=+
MPEPVVHDAADEDNMFGGGGSGHLEHGSGDLLDGGLHGAGGMGSFLDSGLGASLGGGSLGGL